MAWLRHEDGFVPVEWTVALAVLVLPMLLLVLIAPGWVAARDAASVAAREGVRAAAAAGTHPTAVAAAEQAVAQVLADRRIARPVTVDVAIAGGRDPADVALPRDGDVVVAVTIALPASTIPVIGSLAAFDVSASHRRPLDPLRTR